MAINKNKCKYINTQLGDFDIIDYLGNKKYLGRCRKCGFEKTFLNGYFTAKNTINKGVCGCSRSGIQPGDRFGRLTVIKRDLNITEYQGEARVFWLCQCDCGNQKSVMSKHLHNGAVTSCGCYMREVHKEVLGKYSKERFIDLTGQKIGLLTVLGLATDEELEKANKQRNRENRNYWKCKCDCGNTTFVNANDLNRKRHILSCGCLTSRGEYTIIQLLLNNNINFIQQYTFSDFKTINNYPYRFDFAIIDNKNELQYLIEFDGKQHFEEQKFFQDTLLETQTKDKEKNKYCIEHNIPLIRIPYTHLSKLCIEDLLLETTTFLIKE